MSMLPSRVPALVVGFDAKRVITLCEGSLLEPLGIDPRRVVGQEATALELRFGTIDGLLDRALRGESAVQTDTVDGRHVQLGCHPQRSSQGEISGAILVITESMPAAATDPRPSAGETRPAYPRVDDAVFILDSQGRYLEIAPTDPRLLYRPPEDLIDRTLHDVFSQEQADYFLETIHEALQRGYTIHLNYTLRINGTHRHFAAAISPLPPDRVVWVARQFIPGVDPDEALRETEERYRQLFDSIADICFVIDRDWVYSAANKAAVSITRHNQPDFIGRSAQQIIPESERKTLISPYQQVMETGRPRRFVADRPLLPGCLPGTFELLVYPISEGIMCIAHDVTERMRAEQALRQSEERYHTVFEESREGIFITTLEGKIIDFNQAALNLFGLTRQDVATTSVAALYADQKDREKYIAVMSEQGAVRDYPLRLRRSDGTEIDCVITATLWHDPDGTVRGYQGLVRDITAQKRADEALRESEERYRHLVESSPEPLAVHIAGKLVYVNTACVKMLGAQTADELLGRDVMGFVHPDYREIVTQRIRQVQQSGQDAPLIQEKFIRLDGSIIDVEVVSIPTVYHGRIGSQVIMRDITDRVRAEASERALTEALRETSAALNSTLDLSEVLDLILSSVGQVVPHEAATIMLIDEDGTARVVGHHGYAERGFAHDVETLQFTVDVVPNLAQMQHTRQPLIIPDLDTFPGWLKMPHTEWIKSYVGAPISLGEQVIGFINLDSSIPAFYTPAHGDRLRTFADQAAIAIKNARLYNDLRRHAAELQDRNNDLDAFSHTVAHDLKAPLHVIIGYASLILSDYQDQIHPEVLSYLENVSEYANKLDTLIESMMLLAKLRSAEAQIVLVEPQPVVASAIDRFRRDIVARKIRVEIMGDLPLVMAHAPWLEEVFANLIDNAIKYLGSKNPAPYITISGIAQHDGTVRFQVEDNGIGISEEHVGNLFKMFTRVHPSDEIKGAGLGLSIVERIVHRLNGQVGVESVPGKGSIFWFSLPGVAKDKATPESR